MGAYREKSQRQIRQKWSYFEKKIEIEEGGRER